MDGQACDGLIDLLYRTAPEADWIIAEFKIDRLAKPADLAAHVQRQGYDRHETFVVANITTLVQDDPSAISVLWDWFAGELTRCEPIAQPGDYYGIAFYPDDWEGRGYLYMAAVEVAGMDLPPAPWS